MYQRKLWQKIAWQKINDTSLHVYRKPGFHQVFQSWAKLINNITNLNDPILAAQNPIYIGSMVPRDKHYMIKESSQLNHGALE